VFDLDGTVFLGDELLPGAKLQIAFDAIWFHKRATLIATNPDRFCPFPGGRGEPDCAAITAAIEMRPGSPICGNWSPATGRRSSWTASTGCCRRTSGRSSVGMSKPRR
jgi:ribonucleotide monophosphatase NagD (HAD superfamily)